MSNTHTTNQPGDGTIIKDISDHSVGLALVEATLGTTSDNPTCILTTVLQKGEALRYFRCSIHCRVV